MSRSSRKRARKRSSPSRSAGASASGSSLAASSSTRVRSWPSSDRRATVSSETPTIGERNSATSDRRSSGSSMHRQRARQIAHLLRGEEAAPAHDEVRQRRRAQRVEVVGQVREATQQDRDVTEPAAARAQLRRCGGRRRAPRAARHSALGPGATVMSSAPPSPAQRRCERATDRPWPARSHRERARTARWSAPAATAPSGATASAAPRAPPRATSSSAARANTATSAPRNS